MKKEKKFFIPANNIKDLLTDWNEAGGCFASDRITVDGLPVGYMYREIPDGESPFGEYDSGWRFFAGDEDDEYANNPENLDIYSLNTICNYSPDIIPLLHAPYGTAYGRDENGMFQEESLESLEWNVSRRIFGIFRRIMLVTCGLISLKGRLSAEH